MNKKSFKNIVYKLTAGLMSAAFLLPQFTINVEAATGNIDTTIVADSLLVAKEIEAEGIVLLKNEDNILPLSTEVGVNVFGCAAIDPYYGSSGSGSIKSDNMIGFYDALDAEGIAYNKELHDSYSSWYAKKGNHKEMPASEIDFEQANEYSDTAIIMIGRCGSEGGDLEVSELQLTADESTLVQAVATRFSDVIVLFNIVNIMEMGFLEEYDSIKGAAIIWNPGEAGMESVAKMLSGKVNPSGRLQDTIAYNVSDHPSSDNFGDFTYADEDANFVEYEEGIYVGYRYFETFDVEVQYPFGYGLSYTDFEWSDIYFERQGENCKVTISVTNTGAVAGKDVVEVYVTVPYFAGGVEKSSIQLVSYVKTDLIAAGETSTYEVSFNIWDFASYDEDEEEAYILDAGDYIVHVAGDVENVKEDFSFTIDEKLIKKNDDASGAEIKNLFDDAYTENMTVLSRTDAAGTYPSAPSAENCPVDISDMDKTYPIDDYSDEIPAIGAIYEDTILLQDLAANPQLEDEFLDQLTLDEMINLICNCGYKTPSVNRLGIPSTNDNDGPASVKGEGGLLYSDSGVAWPAGVCLACTWNDELAYEHGVRAGIEAKNIGTDVWYAPTANIHRNPRGGRNFEYFSEDPIVCGRMASAIVKGAQSEGLTVTVKHLVLNEQETNRWGVLTWADEQTIREIYLKPFEMAIKDGGAKGIMSAYSRLGKTWCGGNNVLLKDLLRTEWGYKYYVISDFSVHGLYGSYMNPIQATYARNDANLTGIYAVQFLSIKSDMKKEYQNNPAAFGQAMRECVRDIIHMKMNSTAFMSTVTETATIHIEGETAKVSGKSVKNAGFTEKADGASQGYVLCNLSKKGNVITWTVNAPEEGIYDLTMALASTNLFGKNVILGDQVKMLVNGTDIDLSEMEILGSGVLKYNRYSTYGPLQIELVEGSNEITWTVTGYSVPNVDYLEFYKVDLTEISPP